MPKEKVRYLLVDGSQVLHKVLHTPIFKTYVAPDGRDIGGMLGFLGSVHLALTTYKPEKAFLVWDGGGWSPRRLKLYPNYKSNRLKRQEDPEFLEHMEKFRKQRSFVDMLFVNLLKIPSVRLEGREGDDIIAWIASHKPPRVDEFIIQSNDRDFRQLISPSVSVYTTTDSKILLTDGTPPPDDIPFEQEAVFKSCCGDASDGITAVEGVAEGTIRPLFKDFTGTTLGEFYDHILQKEGQSARIDRLIAGFDIVIRNYHLVKLGLEVFTEKEAAILSQVTNREISAFPKEAEILGFLDKFGIERYARNFEEFIIPFRKIWEASLSY